MPNIVNSRPVYGELKRLMVANDVRSSDIATWDANIKFALAHNKHISTGTHFLPITGSYASLASTKTHCQHYLSPGTSTLIFELELATNISSTNAVRSCYIDVSSSSGNTWLGPSMFDVNADSSRRTLQYPFDDTASTPSYRGYLDVTGWEDKIHHFEITITNDAGAGNTDAGQGLYRLNVCEAPRAFVDVINSPTTQPGLNEGWTRPGERIVQGTTNLNYGTIRLNDQIDALRTKYRKHWQICTHSDAPRVWFSITGVENDLNYQHRNASNVRLHYMATRKLYGAKLTTTPYTFSVWYKTSTNSGAVDAFNIDLWYRPNGSSDPFNSVNLQCPPSTTWTNATTSVNFPNTGTNGCVEFYFTTTIVPSNEYLYFTNLAIIENVT